MRKESIKTGFYKQYEKDKKRNIPEPEKSDKVIVINQESKESLLSTIFRGISGVFRVIVYILLFILSSIGLTAIINESTRIKLMELIKLIK